MRTLNGLCLLGLLCVGLTRSGLAQESPLPGACEEPLALEPKPSTTEAPLSKSCLTPQQAEQVTGVWALTTHVYAPKPASPKAGLAHYHLGLSFDGCQLQSDLVSVGLNGKALAPQDWQPLSSVASLESPGVLRLDLSSTLKGQDSQSTSFSLSLLKPDAYAAHSQMPTSYGVWHQEARASQPLSWGIVTAKRVPERPQKPTKAILLSPASCQHHLANTRKGETLYHVLHCGGRSSEAAVLFVSPTFKHLAGVFRGMAPTKNQEGGVDSMTLDKVEVVSYDTSASVWLRTVFRSVSHRKHAPAKRNVVATDYYQAYLVNGRYWVERADRQQGFPASDANTKAGCEH